MTRTRVTLTLVTGERLTGVVNYTDPHAGAWIEFRTGTEFRRIERAEIADVKAAKR